MRKICLALLLVLTSSLTYGQRPEPQPVVYVYVENNPHPMTAVTSQTETRRGWDIQGIRVGQKAVRYLWGKKARQQTERRPTFAIYPRQENLNDYVLIRLKTKRTYRTLPKARWEENAYTRVDLSAFRIENLPGMGFAVTPLSPLPPGEYILFNLAQTPVNEYGDFRVFDFSIPSSE